MSLFREGLAPFPSDAAVSPPRGACGNGQCLPVVHMATVPPKYVVNEGQTDHTETVVPEENYDTPETVLPMPMEKYVAELDIAVVSEKDRLSEVPESSGNEQCLLGDDMVTVPPEYVVSDGKTDHIMTVVPDEGDDIPKVVLPRPMCVAELDIDVVSDIDLLIEFPEISLTVGNSKFRTGTMYVPEFCKETTWLCFLSAADMETRHYRTELWESDGQSLDHRSGVVWNPDVERQRDVCICYDCLHLIILCRNTALIVQVWNNWRVWTGLIAGNYG